MLSPDIAAEPEAEGGEDGRDKRHLPGGRCTARRDLSFEYARMLPRRCRFSSGRYGKSAFVRCSTL